MPPVYAGPDPNKAPGCEADNYLGLGADAAPGAEAEGCYANSKKNPALADGYMLKSTEMEAKVRDGVFVELDQLTVVSCDTMTQLGVRAGYWRNICLVVVVDESFSRVTSRVAEAHAPIIIRADFPVSSNVPQCEVSSSPLLLSAEPWR